MWLMNSCSLCLHGDGGNTPVCALHQFPQTGQCFPSNKQYIWLQWDCSSSKVLTSSRKHGRIWSQSVTDNMYLYNRVSSIPTVLQGTLQITFSRSFIMHMHKMNDLLLSVSSFHLQTCLLRHPTFTPKRMPNQKFDISFSFHLNQI